MPSPKLLVLGLAVLTAACAGTSGSAPSKGGSGKLAVRGKTYEVRDLAMTFEPGEDAWFRIEGEPVTGGDEDCVPGLSSGVGLYGDLPSSVKSPADLAGQRLRVDFSGDGDDANFCFPGMGGLAGAEEAWITIQSVRGSVVTFTMSGTFKIYDENGDGPIETATASGTATVRNDS